MNVDALDRILLLEERALSRSKQMDGLDLRMYRLERTVWVGVGILACLQFLVPLLLDKVR